MAYLVIDNYLDKKDKYPFDNLKSAFQFMIKLRRGYRQLHAIHKTKATHHRVYVLRSDPFIFCRNCKHFFNGEDTKLCCNYSDVIEEVNYCRVKNFCQN